MNNTPAVHKDGADIQPLGTGAAAPIIATPGTVQLAEWAAELDYAHKMGTAMAHSSFLPKALREKGRGVVKPLDEMANDAAVVILAGKSLGLDPLQSVQNIFPVHGQPSMYARTMSALVVAQGHGVKRVSATDEAVTYAVRRKGNTEWEEFTWTIQRAQKAGYTSNSKYSSDPIAMLGAKALAEACRTVFPDVLLGMAYSVEDLELEDMGERKPAAADAPVPTTKLTRKPAEKKAEAAERPARPAPEPEPQGHPAEIVDAETGEIQEPADEPAPVDFLAECERILGDKKALGELGKQARAAGANEEVIGIITEAWKAAA
ncbi:hypothetical protein [Glutamicibacter sp. FBE19]|uniref:hypothetical protein n=1 Tax=Glutamicibacter sp. FBE19 TaxID=2761534 RepID=UPI0018965B50|nr:hypothetical protein [Glutamicibacter sp. FBE19]MBF6671540.1 hypothetical protein [Glutamicibacter sp. FBE19]